MKTKSFQRLSQLARQNPRELGKVAVVYGGLSQEREVSINSGEYSLQSLQDAGVDAVGIKVNDWQQFIDGLRQQRFDQVFNLLHGGFGEDGGVQALLQLLDISFVGSKHNACCVAMDKQLSKFLFAHHQLRTPTSFLLQADTTKKDLLDAITASAPPLPVVIKPNAEGSSNGVIMISDKQQLHKQALLQSVKYDKLLLEAHVSGTEMTVAVINNEPLLPIEIVPKHSFYNYDAKYLSDATEFHCPPINADKALIAQLQKQAVEAMRIVDARHWGRVDFIVDKQGTPWILEVNLIPGMTSHSLVPMAAKQAGIDFASLVCGLVALGNAPFQLFLHKNYYDCC